MPSARVEAAFWDTSALALLCVHQARTGEARRLAARSGRLVIWWATPVEARGTFRRLMRERALNDGELADALRRLSAIRRLADEVLPTEELRSLAEDVLDRHALRAADAFQLASALVLCNQRPRGRWFVCYDARLAEAADLAGFTVLPRR